MNFFSLDFGSKFSNLFVFRLSYSFDAIFLLFGDVLDDLFFFFGDSFDYVFFVRLKNIFDLREIGFDNLSHSSEVLQ